MKTVLFNLSYMLKLLVFAFCHIFSKMHAKESFCPTYQKCLIFKSGQSCHLTHLYVTFLRPVNRNIERNHKQKQKQTNKQTKKHLISIVGPFTQMLSWDSVGLYRGHLHDLSKFWNITPDWVYSKFNGQRWDVNINIIVTVQLSYGKYADSRRPGSLQTYNHALEWHSFVIFDTV